MFTHRYRYSPATTRAATNKDDYPIITLYLRTWTPTIFIAPPSPRPPPHRCSVIELFIAAFPGSGSALRPSGWPLSTHCKCRCPCFPGHAPDRSLLFMFFVLASVSASPRISFSSFPVCFLPRVSVFLSLSYITRIVPTYHICMQYIQYVDVDTSA